MQKLAIIVVRLHLEMFVSIVSCLDNCLLCGNSDIFLPLFASSYSHQQRIQISLNCVLRSDLNMKAVLLLRSGS
jgi:hypothetical protein